MKRIALSLITIYQKLAFLYNPILGAFQIKNECRFEPTCSRYTYQAIEKYGVFKGVNMGVKRLLHCHPFSKGGYQPVR